MRLLIFGLGYTAARIADAATRAGAKVTATRRSAGPDAAAFDDRPLVLDLIARATHILSSVPPEGERDPVLDAYGDALAGAPARWIGYLSATGVYGDTQGAWVDETAALGPGRRTARMAADLGWSALRDDVRRFRLPGIYGPGRSALDRVRDGSARRIASAGQVFSRVHVDDIATGVLASVTRGPAGAYNLADDLPAPQSAVIEEACALLGVAPPVLTPLAEATLSPAARAFYSENRRIANGKARRLLGWQPLYPDYRAGLRALSATMSPTNTSIAPAAAETLQR